MDYVSIILPFIGGLGMFIYGMQIMAQGLENAAGSKMKSLLEVLTKNKFFGVLLGAFITAVIQSSSATTVMVVGFVNAGIMNLTQAMGVIMGANIGTTVTGWLVSSVEWAKALSPANIAPVAVMIGVIVMLTGKRRSTKDISSIIVGFGILFIGMDMMKDAMVPLQQSEAFIHAMTTISNPVLAILLGAGFTALIQSSSASVGILQALAVSGLIPLSSAIYIIFGQNIGTCITSVLASLGANRNAKRATIIHLSFNIIGTIVFMAFAALVPFVSWMESVTSNPAAQIANTHTIFNIATTLLLIPFGSRLAKLAQVILPVKQEEIEDAGYNIPLTFVDEDNIGSVPIAISSLRKEAMAMLQLAETNLAESMDALCGNAFSLEKIKKREKRIDYINYEITNYMTLVSSLKMNESDSTTCNALYKCFSDIERIGDHAINIIQYSTDEDNKLSSSKYIEDELHQLASLLSKSFSLLSTYSLDSQDECFEKIERIEDRIDELTASYRQAQIERLMEKKVNALDCVIYSEILTDVERVSDHIMNIIQEAKRCNFTLSDEAIQSDPALSAA